MGCCTLLSHVICVRVLFLQLQTKIFEKLTTHKTIWFSLFGTLNLILLLTCNNRWALAYFIEVFPSSLPRDSSLLYVRPARHLSCDCVAFKKLIKKVIVLLYPSLSCDLCVCFVSVCMCIVCVCVFVFYVYVCVYLQTMLHIHAHIGRETHNTYTH